MKTIVKLPRLELEDRETAEKAWYRHEKPVRDVFKKIVSSLKENEKWSDPEFGPQEKDPLGYMSFFANGSYQPPLPDPSKCRWVRPNYKHCKLRGKDDDVSFQKLCRQLEHEE